MLSIVNFDQNFYLSSNSDVNAAVLNGTISSAFEHYQVFGSKEERAPNSLYSPKYYLRTIKMFEVVFSGLFKHSLEHFNYLVKKKTEYHLVNLKVLMLLLFEDNLDVAAAIEQGCLTRFSTLL